MYMYIYMAIDMIMYNTKDNVQSILIKMSF